ncbi:hypothetical protein XENOCAPTIV_010904, partial [Xenoophorus captivus]
RSGQRSNRTRTPSPKNKRSLRGLNRPVIPRVANGSPPTRSLNYGSPPVQLGFTE